MASWSKEVNKKGKMSVAGQRKNQAEFNSIKTPKGKTEQKYVVQDTKYSSGQMHQWSVLGVIKTMEYHLAQSLISIQQVTLAVTATGILWHICVFTEVQNKNWHSILYRLNPFRYQEIKLYWNTVISVLIMFLEYMAPFKLEKFQSSKEHIQS